MDLKVIGAFIVAGLLIPLALWPLWWLTSRDYPILTLDRFFRIENIVFPGMRGTFVGWVGPWDWSLIVIRWAKALTKNAAIYAVVGVVVVLAARLAEKRFGRGSDKK